MSNPITVGVVGCGYWGPNLARSFDNLSNTTLNAICDQSPARIAQMRALYENATFYDDYQHMLNHPSLDAVVIATPLRSHHRLAKSALLAGKHVLIEKPMARTTRECEELIHLAEQQDVVLMVGHTYLYSAAVSKVLEIIRSGDIGDIRYINCQRLNLGLFQHDINVAWDLAPHDLSIIHQVMRDLPSSVNCQGNSHLREGIQDVINMSLMFDGNRFATIQNSWLEPKKVRQMTFVGSRKMILYDDLQPLEKIRIYDVRVDPPPHYHNFSEFQYSYHYGDCHIPRINQWEPLVKMSQHFADCITKHEQPLSCGSNGRDLVRILEASDRSLALGGSSITLDHSATGLPLAGIGSDVRIGKGVKLHGFTNLYGCVIGDHTRIGCFVEIQRGARIGARCKISSHSFICEGVTLEDEVFIGHGVMFTNDKNPRATTALGIPQSPGEWTCQPTVVRRGASIGSGATILSGIVIGENAMIGAGSVVTRDVLPNTTVAGNPARQTQGTTTTEHA